jgi:SAM-dependent methyltransferase
MRPFEKYILNILKHPLTRNLNIDDPKTTYIRKQLIRNKPFLRKIYEDWYSWIASSLPHGEGIVLELGSGAGFLNEFVPDLITTDVFFCPFVDIILDGCSLPFAEGSLKAIVMVDVFHHIPDIESFLREAARCLRKGGKVLMVEPWVTTWSTFVYKHLHHEPFNERAQGWSFVKAGPLTSANSALPWIVFERDRMLFEANYKQFVINNIIIEKPFVYILSGGVSFRGLMPGFSYEPWKRLENLLKRWIDKLGMFASIELSRIQE